MVIMKSKTRITAQPTADLDVCRFILETEILPGRRVSCRFKEAAEGAPILKALFDLDGIREVLVSGSTITVAKSSGEPWSELGKKIGAVIRNVIESGVPAIPSDWEKPAPRKDFIYDEVQKILALRVNPGVATHGGRVELVDVKGTAVYLRMSGGCQGCGAANVTLRQGIEKAIRSKLPEVTEIIDVTDHASGKNPYYKTMRNDGSPL
jgi:Fe-S cluster biogenesis protein NfuA